MTSQMVTQSLLSWDDLSPSNEIECRGLFQVPPLISPMSLAPLASDIFQRRVSHNIPVELFCSQNCTIAFEFCQRVPDPEDTVSLKIILHNWHACQYRLKPLSIDHLRHNDTHKQVRTRCHGYVFTLIEPWASGIEII